jgi:hypothetical protein
MLAAGISLRRFVRHALYFRGRGRVGRGPVLLLRGRAFCAGGAVHWLRHAAKPPAQKLGPFWINRVFEPKHDKQPSPCQVTGLSRLLLRRKVFGHGEAAASPTGRPLADDATPAAAFQ